MVEKNMTLPQLPLKPERSPEFVEAYSNSLAFELSAWDLKVIFGRLDQTQGVVSQHTAITIPWSLAKLALYHLQTHVMTYEGFYGPIKLSDDILPFEPPPLPKELANNPKAIELFEAMKKLRSDFIAEVKKPHS
jgi:hypothetical protein